MSSFSRVCAPAKLAGLAFIASATFASQAGAAVLVNYGPPSSIAFAFDTDAGLEGGGVPGGDTPWFTVTFADKMNGNVRVANTVTATFDVPLSNGTTAGLVAGEFITKFFFNYSSSLTGKFALSDYSSTGGAKLGDSTNGFAYSTTGVGGAGGFTFDMLFNYLKGDDALNAPDKVTFDLVYTHDPDAQTVDPNDPTFSAIAFKELSTKENGSSIYALAHMQGLFDPGAVEEFGENNTEGSLWVTPGGDGPNLIIVPEPGSTAALMGLLSCGLFLRSRRTRTA